jgi:hypothetical protein
MQQSLSEYERTLLIRKVAGKQNSQQVRGKKCNHLWDSTPEMFPLTSDALSILHQEIGLQLLPICPGSMARVFAREETVRKISNYN